MEVIDLNPNKLPTNSAAFLIMYSTDGRPWEYYDLANDDQRELTIPQVLVVGRSDGKLGFVGGHIDHPVHDDTTDIEAIEDGLSREVLEEVGYHLVEEPEPLVRVKGPRLDKYVFSLELPHEELAVVASQAHNAEHFGSEITGTLMLQIADYEVITGKNYGGIQNVLRMPFAASARQELAQLIIKKELMLPDDFERACNKANFQLPELLG